MIEVFDPKVASGLVPIPASQETTPESPLARSLTARWDRGCGLLDLRVTTPDRMLPPTAFRFVASLPKPIRAPPSGPIVVSGAVPIWLHLSYSRWLRNLLPNRALGVWDARSRAAIFVTGPDAPRVERRDLPREHPFKG